MPDNPVRTKLAALRDAFLSVRMGYGGGTQQLQVKEGPDGAVQATYNVTAAEEADLTIANTKAVDANTAEIKGNSAQLKTVAEKLDEANGYARQTAAQAAPGLPYWNDWSSLVGAVTLKAPDKDHDAKVLRCIVSATSLLGNLIGGGAKAVLYYCDGKDDAYTATTAVVIGFYPIANNVSYPVGNGRIVPKGKYLRAHATHGNCGISVDVA